MSATQAGAASTVGPSALRQTITLSATIAMPILAWFAPLGLEPNTQHGLAIMFFLLTAWITESLDYAVAGLIGCFLYWALHVVKFNVAFAGFVNTTAWFIFGAILIGQIATKSTIARRIANAVLLRVGTSYSRLLLGLIITDFLLTFIVPSGVSRIVIMAAIALGLVETFDLKKGSNIARGMFLVLTYTAVFFDKFILAGAASITARGLMEQAGVSISYSEWFAAFAPLDIITVIACWLLTLWMFPPEREDLAGGRAYLEQQRETLGLWRALDTRAAILLGAALLLWMTDFLHGIPAPVVGLGVALASLLPGIGVLTIEDVRRTNLMPFFFVAAAVSMGAVLTATKGLAVISSLVFGWMLPLMHDSFISTTVLYWFAFVYHFFLASEIPMMTTSIPPLMNFATSHGLSPIILGLTWAFAAGGKLFAYQSAVTMIGYSYGYFSVWDMVKLGFVLTVLEWLLLLLVVPFYWPLIGIS
jgi:solute carrier family 13 (sodium-dependent dicarboxylate transporter), member 2/3/5